MKLLLELAMTVVIALAFCNIMISTDTPKTLIALGAVGAGTLAGFGLFWRGQQTQYR